MELKFLGRGAGFNPSEGSTSAYFLDNNELFLIDCGESIFKTLLDRKIMDSVTALHVLITHTHSDHVGSLGSLMLYFFNRKKIAGNIIIGENMLYQSSIRSLLTIFGLRENMYRFVEASEYDSRYSGFSRLRFIQVQHASELEACALLFETDKGLVFYSGDMKDNISIVEIIESKRQIDKIFIDVCSNRENQYHVSVHEVNNIVPPALKSKIYCMHIDNSQCIEDAYSYGFNVVSVSLDH